MTYVADWNAFTKTQDGSYVSDVIMLDWDYWPTQFRSNGRLFCLSYRSNQPDGKLLGVHYTEYLGEMKVFIYND